MSKVVTQVQTLQVDEITGRDGGAVALGTTNVTGNQTVTGTTTLGTAAAMLKDAAGDILLASGTTVPTDTTTGYAKGCLFMDTDVASGTGGLYANQGTNTSCLFTLVTQAA